MSLPRRRRWFVESLPRNILADTGTLFALIHAGDPDHARAVQFAGTYSGPLTTIWPVVTEAAYLLEKYAGRGVERLLGMVLDGELLVADLVECWNRFAPTNNQPPTNQLTALLTPPELGTSRTVPVTGRPRDSVLTCPLAAGGRDA